VGVLRNTKRSSELPVKVSVTVVICIVPLSSSQMALRGEPDIGSMNL
jgi:hypothetical protein